MSINVSATTLPFVVRSGQGEYRVDFFEDTEPLKKLVGSTSEAFVLIDEKVRRLYPALLGDVDPARVLELTASEDEKSLAGVERAALFLQRGAASRSSTLIVIGGGIMQDIGAFVAHIYYRGIPYLHFPTTLLSMADSCIGAKCGVNLGSFKNQLGFFQSPARVAVASEFLQTLPADDVRSGFGEILKLAITSGEASFDWFEERLTEYGFGLQSINEAIVRSLEIKRAIIEEDEYERGLRKTLNYGHTFAHAFETVTQHEVPHGLAVAWGVDIANYVAVALGRLDRAIYERIHRLIASNFRFELRRKYDATSLVAAMKRDKKAAAGNVQLILASGLGRLAIVPTALNGELERVIEDYLRRDNICTTHH